MATELYCSGDPSSLSIFFCQISLMKSGTNNSIAKCRVYLIIQFKRFFFVWIVGFHGQRFQEFESIVRWGLLPPWLRVLFCACISYEPDVAGSLWYTSTSTNLVNNSHGGNQPLGHHSDSGVNDWEHFNLLKLTTVQKIRPSLRAHQMLIISRWVITWSLSLVFVCLKAHVN